MNHIILVTTSFPSNALYSGQEAAGSFVYDFVHELSNRAKVTVVAPGSTNCRMEVDGISVNYFAASSLPLSLLKPTNPLKWQPIIRTLKSGQRAVLDTVKETKPHHIFALWALPSGYWAKTAGDQTGTPYSIWALGSDIWTLGKIPLVQNTLRSVLRSSANCFADGYKLAKDVTIISGKSCDFLPSCRILPVNTIKTLATSPPYRLAFLGRWHRNKGIDLLLDSLDLLQPDDWERIHEIRICGGGPLAKLVNEKCRQLEKQGHPVTAEGYMNVDQAASLYNWTDYLLIPSRIESIPVVFSDAMQCMCPVIATPVGDLPRLLGNSKVGVLSDEVSSNSYYAAITSALDSPPSIYDTDMGNAKTVFNVKSSVDTVISFIR